MVTVSFLCYDARMGQIIEGIIGAVVGAVLAVIDAVVSAVTAILSIGR